MLIWILIFTFLGSVVSLSLAALLFLRGTLAEKKLPLLVAFAAGALLTASFFDLLPEALSEGGEGQNISSEVILQVAFLGMVVFFFLERSLLWYHHHACPEGKNCEGTKPTASLIIISDTLHNFLDGVTIAAAFLVNFPLGVITSLAVFFHEIPQEIGDFGVLLDSGLKRSRVFLYNILSSAVALAGAFLGFYFLQEFASLIPFLIAFAAGNFIYIAASDLIPEIHHHFKKEIAISQTVSFVVGISMILLTIKIFE